MPEEKNGGRISTRQFYEALLNQNKDAAEREQRIITKIDTLTLTVSAVAKQPEICQAYFKDMNNRIDSNKEEIGKSRLWEKLLALFTMVAAALGIGIKQ